MEFSLFYFDGKGGVSDDDKYRLLIEGARFADVHGFSAVWTPERHFHPFGGIYPNPSLTSAALATITKRVQLRAGSVVAPLHEFVRIAEEWAVVDNLSGGRVGISFASGWHADDFALYPSRYKERKESMVQAIDMVQRLWGGEFVTLQNGVGRPITLKIFPQPVQKKLPIWVTCSGNPETFELAGQLGAGVLTHLLGQSLPELEEKIGVYRQARARFQHAGEGHVTVMVHTFLGETIGEVRSKIYRPFSDYLASSLNLIRKQLLNNAATDSPSPMPWRKSKSSPIALGKVSVPEEDGTSQELVEHAFDRYFDTAALFGTPEKCLRLLQSFDAAGVNEVACLIDFGVDLDSVLTGLEYLDEARKLCQKSRREAESEQVLSFNERL
jgi:natural product biosynthesis luciferase-like monooxygenase protein